MDTCIFCILYSQYKVHTHVILDQTIREIETEMNFGRGKTLQNQQAVSAVCECVYSVDSVLCTIWYGMHTFSIAVIKLLAVRAHSMVPLFISLETDSIYPFLLVFAMTMVQTKSRQNTGNCRIVMSPIVCCIFSNNREVICAEWVFFLLIRNNIVFVNTEAEASVVCQRSYVCHS